MQAGGFLLGAGALLRMLRPMWRHKATERMSAIGPWQRFSAAKVSISASGPMMDAKT